MYVGEERTYIHVTYLLPFTVCMPTCVVCTYEFLDLRGGLTFMHVNYEENGTLVCTGQKL